MAIRRLYTTVVGVLDVVVLQRRCMGLEAILNLDLARYCGALSVNIENISQSEEAHLHFTTFHLYVIGDMAACC
jgi:hypothetical protein